MDRTVNKFCNIIHYKFKDPTLLGYVIKHIQDVTDPNDIKNFERLELLGDSVLNMVVSEMLFLQFPNKSRGVLSKMKAKLVCSKTLANLGKMIRLPSFVGLEDLSNQKRLEDSVEALIGAIYVDGGFYTAKTFVETRWNKKVRYSTDKEVSFKTTLNNWTQKNEKPMAEYSLIERIGPHHEVKLRVSVAVEGVGSAEAIASSRKTAEEIAARELLKKVWEAKKCNYYDS